jgi:hypothetical protein
MEKSQVIRALQTRGVTNMPEIEERPDQIVICLVAPWGTQRMTITVPVDDGSAPYLNRELAFNVAAEFCKDISRWLQFLGEYTKGDDARRARQMEKFDDILALASEWEGLTGKVVDVDSWSERTGDLVSYVLGLDPKKGEFATIGS